MTVQVYYRSQEEGWWEPDTQRLVTHRDWLPVGPGERGEESVMCVRVSKLIGGVSLRCECAFRRDTVGYYEHLRCKMGLDCPVCRHDADYDLGILPWT